MNNATTAQPATASTFVVSEIMFGLSAVVTVAFGS